MTGASFFFDIIRNIFAVLDSIIYGLIETLYQLFAYISKLTIFDETVFEVFQSKVFVILGIVMLFKVSFSLISLLSNPDDLTDSKKGITGIVQRIIISLILITFVSTIFKTAREIQKIVIDENIIGQFFLGDVDDEQGDFTRGAGNYVAFQVLSAFYYPESKIPITNEFGDCAGKDPEIKVPMVQMDAPKIMGQTQTATILKEHADKCSELSGPRGFHYITNHSHAIGEYLWNYSTEQIGADGSPSGKGKYAMRYNWLISTIAGVVVAWLFLGYCIDIAIRSVKLGTLQMIAPIPIFSYIDPKGGEKIFQNWVKTTISTYLSLFGRLVLIYFVLYICRILMTANFSITGDSGTLEKMTPNGENIIMIKFAKAFIYIGLLLFAKDAPKLFADMFGIKMEGSFGMKIAKMGMAGTALATGLGAAKLSGGLYRRHLERRDLKDKKLNFYKDEGILPTDTLTAEQQGKLDDIKSKLSHGYGAKQIARGVGMGITRGALGGKGGKVDLATYRQTRASINSKQKAREDGVGFFDEVKESYSRNTGYRGKSGSVGAWDSELHDAEDKRKTLKDMETSMAREFTKLYSNAAKSWDISEGNTDRLLTAIKKNDSGALNSAIDDIAKAWMKKNGMDAENATEVQAAAAKLTVDLEPSQSAAKQMYNFSSLGDKQDKIIKEKKNLIDTVRSDEGKK